MNLKLSLQEKTGYNFDPSLPVISYYVSQILRDNKAKKFLEHLSNKANVIIKCYNYFLIDNVKGKNLFFNHNLREPILRFASDVTLIPIQSGSIKSGFAFNQRMLPIYSQEIGKNMAAKLKKYFFTKHINAHSYNDAFTQYNDSSATFHSNYNEYFDLVPPVSIYDFEQLEEIIFNKTFWNNFDKKIAIKSKEIFGDVDIYASIQRTSELLINKLD